MVFRHGGLNRTFGYDSGVYFASADALVRGRLPYADFVLLHPPGITLFLTPFAALTHVFSDSTTYSIANLACCVVGAVNAVLTRNVCRSLGLSATASIVAGLFYAVWFGAVRSEYLIRLEPVGNLFLLIALLLVLRARREQAGVWPSVGGGIALGALLSVKIWWVLPVVAVLVWDAWCTRSSGRSRVRMLALPGGTVLALIAINLPFFVAAPGQMWRMIVSDQLSRPPDETAPMASRVLAMSGMRGYGVITTGVGLSCALVVAVLVVVLAGAWNTRTSRAAVVLFLVQFAVVLFGPSWFPHYRDYTAVALAVCVAGAAERARALAFRIGGAVAVSGVAVISLVILVNGSLAGGPYPAGPQLASRLAAVRCIQSDDPSVLIRIDALSRGLSDGCTQWVDVSGRSYSRKDTSVPRSQDLAWQNELAAYLGDGDAVIFVRGTPIGETPEVINEVRRGRISVQADTVRVYLTPEAYHRVTGDG